jgi:predicted MFS family arabinose efflux permease
VSRRRATGRWVVRAAWPTIAVCTVAIGLGAALGFVPGYVATELQQDLGISRAQVGLIVSLYFGSTGAASIVSGRLTDRLGARKVVAADLVLVAVSAAVAAVTGRFAWLLATSVIAGAGYAWANAGTNLAIARRVPAGRRTIALSVKTAGVPAMASLAAALATPSADRWSWRSVWFFIAIVAAIAAVAAWTVLDDVTSHGSGHTGPVTAVPAGMWWFAVAAFLLVGGSQPLFSWIVPYLRESFDVGPGAAGAIASLAAAIGVTHLVVNGYLADRGGPERRIRRITVLAAVSAAAVLLVWAGPVIGVVGVAVGDIVGISVQLAAIGTMHAAIVDRAPWAVAGATGITMTGYYLGALVSPVGFGALVDATGSYGWGWFALACMLAASIPAWHMGGRIPIATTRPAP